MNNNNIAVQNFLNSVKEDVKQSNETCDVISFSDFWDKKYMANDVCFDKRGFLGDTAQIQSFNQISYYKELTSYKKGVTPIVRFFKRGIRKCVAFLFLPLVAEQNVINSNVARLMMSMRSYINSEENNRGYLLKNTSELEMQVRSQQKTINQLMDTVNALNEKIDCLEKNQEVSKK